MKAVYKEKWHFTSLLLLASCSWNDATLAEFVYRIDPSKPMPDANKASARFVIF